MPFYEYSCTACSTHFEVRTSMAEYGQGATPTCPECGSSDTRRVLASPNILSSSPGRGSQDGGCCPQGRCG